MRRSLAFRSAPPVTVWWEAIPRRDILAEAQRALPNETGGVLLGWSTDSDIVITHAVGPGARAEHQPTRFLPDRDWQADEIARLYEESGRTIEYLGDWHTHPGGDPYPSALDSAALRRIALDEAARCPRPIMGILGNIGEGPLSAVFHVYYGRSLCKPSIRAARLRLI